MISVIIPVLNESGTIGALVSMVRGVPCVREVIVVDDGSIDPTPELARSAGATVITSTLLGKGASLEDGMRAAGCDIVLYLDGDLVNLRPEVISALAAPIAEGRADFVKARFSRSGGRVTTLTARPHLSTFFPELDFVGQPLGGIVAARRALLEKLRFETDYGVDVGLLLDVFAMGARIAEVEIGDIEHDSHPLEVLGDMAKQVARVILDRAARYGRLHKRQIQEVQEVERHTQAEIALMPEIGTSGRLALFDMDGVLLDGRFVVQLAERTGKADSLAELLDNFTLPDDERTRRIAGLFRGVPRETFEATARAMPLVPHAPETIVGLRRAGFRVGIVTDSYMTAAETVRRRVFADFSIAHLMRFGQGKATGECTLSPGMVHPEGCLDHRHCKRNVMLHLCANLRVVLRLHCRLLQHLLHERLMRHHRLVPPSSVRGRPSTLCEASPPPFLQSRGAS